MITPQIKSSKVKKTENRQEYMKQYYLQKKALLPPKEPKQTTIKKTADMKTYKLEYNRALLLKKNGVIKAKGRPKSIDDMKLYRRSYSREWARRKRIKDEEELINSITILTDDVFKNLVIE